MGDKILNNWYKHNLVFFWTILIALAVVVFGALYSMRLSNISSDLMNFVSYNFGWFYILSIVAFIGFLFFDIYQ